MAPKRVLLVEDDADIRASVRDLLEEEGYEVYEARHGQDALDKLPFLPPLSLAVVDLLMPVMDGNEFIARLRSGTTQAQVPLVVMSASSTARPPGGIPFLQKPVGLREFLSTVQEVSALAD